MFNAKSHWDFNYSAPLNTEEMAEKCYLSSKKPSCGAQTRPSETVSGNIFARCFM